jgi:hypothetical protein
MKDCRRDYYFSEIGRVFANEQNLVINIDIELLQHQDIYFLK